MNVEIKCPNCGAADSIQEIYYGATVYANVLSLSDEDITTDELRIVDTDDFYYSCSGCGKVLAYSADELYEVLTGVSEIPDGDDEEE